MMPAIRCCHNCTDRHYKCHSECEKYIKARAVLDQYKNDLSEDKKKNCIPPRKHRHR